MNTREPASVAIIPARGGSKRIPGKNIRPFAGKPMIARSIEAARQSGVFGRIIVSTDSPEIAGVARDQGAETPFLRPDTLSGDHTPTAPVLLHALDWLEENGSRPEYCCCIYATAPFVRPEDIRRGFDLIREQRAAAAFSVATFSSPIFRALRLNEAGRLAMFWPEHETTRSQDLPEAYHDAGQFYWLEVVRFKATGRIFAPDALPVVLPRYLVQDIDTPEDWETAERMYRGLYGKAGH